LLGLNSKFFDLTKFQIIPRFFRKKQSSRKAASTVLLESEFDFMPDIMILDKIDTPSGTLIDIDHHDSLPLLPLSETPFPDSIHPLVEQDNSLDPSPISIDTLPSETNNDLVVDTTDPNPVDSTIDEVENPAANAQDDDQAEPSEVEDPVAEIEVTDEIEEPLDLAEEPIAETETTEEDIETEVTDELDQPLDLAKELPAESEVIGGFFTVGNDSVVAIDWLYDGGGYSHGQMGIFFLDDLDINSPDFTSLALQRVMSNSGLGYVVLDDAIEGAKFISPENAGTYAGLKIMSLQAGGTYAIVLIPNGTFEEALTKLTNGEELSRQLQPIFSLTTTNPGDQFSSGLLVDVTGDGTPSSWKICHLRVILT
jgi:hypothetical protein